MTTIVQFHDVSLRYHDNDYILRNINFELERGKFYTLLGPSGCGKTTILRLIAGFLQPTEGEVYIDGKCMNGLAPNERPVNTVFQDYALFPHLNVFENVAFGLRIQKVKEAEVKRRVEEALRFVSLEGFASREIQDMSGGQRQRVAIARAIVNEPDLILLDEPLSALDLKLRTAMQSELRALQQKLGKTFVFVTHDQEEALAMSDEIFVIQDGQIAQSGTPLDIYDEPINRFVASFIGQSNIIPGEMVEDYVVRFNGREFPCVDGGLQPNEKVEVVIRPEDLKITSAAQGNVNVTVISQLFRGVHYEFLTQDDNGNKWLVHSTQKSEVGEVIGLSFTPEDLHIMRLNESEEAFDLRMETYGGDSDV